MTTGPSDRAELEESIQCRLVHILRRSRIFFAHVPNASMATVGYRRKLDRLGLLKGCPDLLIFDSPPTMPHKKGVALELKKNGGRLRPDQVRVLTELEARGWVSATVYSYQEAIDLLNSLGYEIVEEHTIPY